MPGSPAQRPTQGAWGGRLGLGLCIGTEFGQAWNTTFLAGLCLVVSRTLLLFRDVVPHLDGSRNADPGRH